MGKIEESDPPQSPPNKLGFKGGQVKSRVLSRNFKKGSNNQKKRKPQQPVPEEDSAAFSPLTLH